MSLPSLELQGEAAMAECAGPDFDRDQFGAPNANI
jgi:hypothetical protein